MKPFTLGVIMDPIAQIHYHKDSTLALLLAAQRRGWSLYYMEQADLFLQEGKPFANMAALQVEENPHAWFQLDKPKTMPLKSLDIILMRKDPPFDTEYIYTTYLLELAEQHGVFVVNKPQSLRDVNEKFFTAWFPHCCPPTLVTRSAERIRQFIQEHHDVILKPLDSMGGISVFHLKANDENINVIIETLTHFERRSIMVQRFIPDIHVSGDKRILLIDGEPIPYALARRPAPGEHRGNLASGGTGHGQPLTERDRWICAQVAPTLKAKGLLFVGIDVIGDYLTEINVTSPTCIRELDKQFNLTIADQVMDAIARIHTT